MDNNIIALAGDWHIDVEWALSMLEILHEKGITEVYHVGDFGFDATPEGEDYLTRLNDYCKAHGMVIHVTPGNHENFPFMNYEFNVDTVDGFKTSSKWDCITVIPRGGRWVRGGKTFVSLGGANSINYRSLIPNVDWWAEESISLGDVYRAIEGGHAHVMITHDAPLSLDLGDNDGDSPWSLEDMEYSKQSRIAVEQAVAAIQPDVLFHGHHHFAHDTLVPTVGHEGPFVQRVVGLDMNGHVNNLAFLYLDSMSVRMVSY